MSPDYGIAIKYDWKEINKYGCYKPKFIKRFKIDSVVLMGEDLIKVIKGEGFGDLALTVDFEIEVDGKKYILSTEMQDENDKHVSGVDASVYFIQETSESERFLNDAIEKLDLSQEDKEDIGDIKAYFFSRFFTKFPYFYSKGEPFELLRTLINEMEIVTNTNVFNTLRKRVQTCALEVYGIDFLASIKREEKK